MTTRAPAVLIKGLSCDNQTQLKFLCLGLNWQNDFVPSEARSTRREEVNVLFDDKSQSHDIKDIHVLAPILSFIYSCSHERSHACHVCPKFWLLSSCLLSHQTTRHFWRWNEKWTFIPLFSHDNISTLPNSFCFYGYFYRFPLKHKERKTPLTCGGCGWELVWIINL